jgi:hypothetical protein
MLTINIALDNKALYQGCTVHRPAGKRPRIDTTMFDGIDIVKQNAEGIFASWGLSPGKKGDSLLLTGSMLSWATIAVVVAATTFFNEIHYEDDSGRKMVYRRPVNG